MPRRASSPRRFLVVAIALTSSLFLVHESFTRRSFDASLEDVTSIVADSMPTIVDLVEARRDLTAVQLELDQVGHLSSARRDSLAREVHGQLDAIAARVVDYERLPTLPGEVAEQRRLDAALENFRRAATRVLEVGDAARAEAILSSDVAPSGEEASRIMEALIEWNAREATNRNRQVVATHSTAKQTSLVFLGAILVAIGSLGVLAHRWLARAQRTTETRMAELDAFASRVAHDLRGPLAPVLLALSLLRREPGLGGHGLELIDKARLSVRQMNLLIDALLEFARSGAVPAPGSRCSVEEVTAQTLATLGSLAVDERARIDVAIEPGLAVRATAGVLSSILGNLVRNALLYMGESENRVVTVRARREGALAVLEIEDTGPGIPPDVLVRIFRPFERASLRPGHGLGLATVRRLAEAHGGQATVRSHVGIGSTFQVTLPVAD